MSADDDAPSRLAELLCAANRGDTNARQALIAYACDRLRRLARRMFRDYPRLRRWEETDDVFQAAMFRLYRSLGEAQPSSTRHFFNLAALQIRRTLLDLARRHFGPEGHAANHYTDGLGLAADDAGGPLHSVDAAGEETMALNRWTAFHEAIDNLTDQHREMFDLLWYQGLEQEEAARLLGVSIRTVKRRWQSARLALHAALHEGESTSDGL